MAGFIVNLERRLGELVCRPAARDEPRTISSSTTAGAEVWKVPPWGPEGDAVGTFHATRSTDAPRPTMANFVERSTCEPAAVTATAEQPLPRVVKANAHGERGWPTPSGEPRPSATAWRQREVRMLVRHKRHLPALAAREIADAIRHF